MFHSVGSRASHGSVNFPQLVGPAGLTLVKKGVSQSISSGVQYQPTWDTIVQDTVGAFSAASNTIMKVPYGYTRARHFVTLLNPTGGLSNLGVQWIWFCLNGTGNPIEGQIENSMVDHRQTLSWSRWFEGLLPMDTFTILAEATGGGTGLIGPSGTNAPMWGVEWERS